MFGWKPDPKLQPEEPPRPEEMPEGVIISPDTRRENRIPPRQSRTRKWPVLDASGPPKLSLDHWRFTLGGLIESPVEWNWQEFQRLPRVRVFAEMNCRVTGQVEVRVFDACASV